MPGVRVHTLTAKEKGAWVDNINARMAQLKQRRERSTNLHGLRGRNYRRGNFLGQLKVQKDRAPSWRPPSSRLLDVE